MRKFLDKFEFYTILLSASLIIIFVFFSIIFRYLFNIVLSWPDELSRYLQIYIVWMGASASVTKKMVLKIDFLNIVLKDDRRIGLLADVITLAGSIILFVAICKFTVNKFQIMETSMVIGIPIWWIGLIISLSIVALMVKVSTSILDFFIQGEKVASAP